MQGRATESPPEGSNNKAPWRAPSRSPLPGAADPSSAQPYASLNSDTEELKARIQHLRLSLDNSAAHIPPPGHVAPTATAAPRDFLSRMSPPQSPRALPALGGPGSPSGGVGVGSVAASAALSPGSPQALARERQEAEVRIAGLQATLERERSRHHALEFEKEKQRQRQADDLRRQLEQERSEAAAYRAAKEHELNSLMLKAADVERRGVSPRGPDVGMLEAELSQKEHEVAGLYDSVAALTREVDTQREALAAAEDARRKDADTIAVLEAEQREQQAKQRSLPLVWQSERLKLESNARHLEAELHRSIQETEALRASSAMRQRSPSPQATGAAAQQPSVSALVLRCDDLQTALARAEADKSHNESLLKSAHRREDEVQKRHNQEVAELRSALQSRDEAIRALEGRSPAEQASPAQVQSRGAPSEVTAPSEAGVVSNAAVEQAVYAAASPAAAASEPEGVSKGLSATLPVAAAAAVGGVAALGTQQAAEPSAATSASDKAVAAPAPAAPSRRRLWHVSLKYRMAAMFIALTAILAACASVRCLYNSSGWFGWASSNNDGVDVCLAVRGLGRDLRSVYSFLDQCTGEVVSSTAAALSEQVGAGYLIPSGLVLLLALVLLAPVVALWVVVALSLHLFAYPANFSVVEEWYASVVAYVLTATGGE
eukprot:Rhum_TRINITY_DN6328_c0_g1::Rhum_TRINITY_DN6328_c0_g1_i1::g.19777::m.19777